MFDVWEDDSLSSPTNPLRPMTTTNDTADVRAIDALLPGQRLCASINRTNIEDLNASFASTIEAKLQRTDQANLGGYIQDCVNDWRGVSNDGDELTVSLADRSGVVLTYFTEVR